MVGRRLIDVLEGAVRTCEEANNAAVLAPLRDQVGRIKHGMRRGGRAHAVARELAQQFRESIRQLLPFCELRDIQPLQMSEQADAIVATAEEERSER